MPVFRNLGIPDPELLLQPNLESVILSVRSGLGLALLDSTVRLPDDGSVIPVPLKDTLDYMIAWRKDNDNIAINFFVDIVKSMVIEK